VPVVFTVAALAVLPSLTTDIAEDDVDRGREATPTKVAGFLCDCRVDMCFRKLLLSLSSNSDDDVVVRFVESDASEEK